MSSNITWHPGAVTRAERVVATGAEGATLWLTGLSGSGKSTVATAVEHQSLLDRGGDGRLARAGQTGQPERGTLGTGCHDPLGTGDGSRVPGDVRGHLVRGAQSGPRSMPA